MELLPGEAVGGANSGCSSDHEEHGREGGGEQQADESASQPWSVMCVHPTHFISVAYKNMPNGRALANNRLTTDGAGAIFRALRLPLQR
jgi:hypothetical protein